MLRQYDESLLDTDPENIEATRIRRIFCVPFEILIKNQFLISEEEVGFLGVRMYGGREADMMMSDMLTTTYAYIANMADLMNAGIPFVINQPHKMRQIADYIDDYLQLGVESLNQYHLTEEFLEDKEEFKRFYQDLLKLETLGKSVKNALMRFEVTPHTPQRIKFGQAVTRGFVMLKPSDREAAQALERQRLSGKKTYSILQQLSEQNKRAVRLFTPKGWR